jgi:hypothetical protein
MKKNRAILIGVILLMPSSFLFMYGAYRVREACKPNHLYRYYDFTDTETTIPDSNLRVIVYLSGEYVDKGHVDGLELTEFGNPYDLHLRVKSPDRTNRSLILESVILTDQSENVVCIKDTEIGEEMVFENSRDGEWIADVSLNNIFLKYESHRISIRFNVFKSGSNEPQRESIEFKIDLKCREEKHSNFVDAIMSV